jgi:hypothetical protein
MKKICTILGCVLLTIPLAGNTYRVNNQLTSNPSGKIYSRINDAHDVATTGDTILVEASPSDYAENLTITKKLVIKGPGYFLDENPGISANKLSAVIGGQIEFAEGSSGSVLMGIVDKTSFVNINTSNITIRRCNLVYTTAGNGVSNLVISECFFSEGYYPCIGSNIVSNLVVSNCIIKGNILLLPSCTGYFINNIFTASSISIPTGFVMKNNILFTTEKADIHLPALDAAVSYNISISDHFGTANNNKANVSSTALFVGDATESTDGKWKLKAGSPAIAAGESGVDCGAYGGPNPYILSGLPTGPMIYELNVSSYANTSGKLPMTIKVKNY